VIAIAASREVEEFLAVNRGKWSVRIKVFVNLDCVGIIGLMEGRAAKI
jgi:hypothetical protein